MEAKGERGFRSFQQDAHDLGESSKPVKLEGTSIPGKVPYCIRLESKTEGDESIEILKSKG